MTNKNSLCTKKERRHIIDTFNIFILLRDKSISGFMLEKETGVSRTTLLKVRTNKEQFQNLSIKTLSKSSRRFALVIVESIYSIKHFSTVLIPTNFSKSARFLISAISASLILSLLPFLIKHLSKSNLLTF